MWISASEMDPVAWWNSYCRRQLLSKIAVIFLSLPSTAAGCERNWSDFSRVQTKLRNRLLNRRTEKLVCIKRNLPIVSPSKSKKLRPETCSDTLDDFTGITSDDDLTSDWEGEEEWDNCSLFDDNDDDDEEED